MELAQRLKAAREDADLSVKAASDKLGITRVQLWRMEKDANFVSVGRLKELAKLYGVQFETFFNDGLETKDQEISYQLIEQAISMVHDVAGAQPSTPPSQSLVKATIAVIRHQHRRWADNPTSKFDPREYTVMIEQQFSE